MPLSSKSVRIRTDKRATKKNILSDLKWLTKGAKTGETLVFWYSGHGSYQIDPHGDEKDGKDECLVPHDYDTAGMIIDDEIQDVIQWLPPTGVNLEIFLDSCFSGTATRSAASLQKREAQRIRFLPPPIDSALIGNSDVVRNPIFSRQTMVIPNINHVLWAGCKDTQTSAETEIEGSPRGVFSYYMCKTLRETAGKITRKGLNTQVSHEIKKIGYDQVPVLEVSEAKMNQQVFR
jgi:hypothetical protein